MLRYMIYLLVLATVPAVAQGISVPVVKAPEVLVRQAKIEACNYIEKCPKGLPELFAVPIDPATGIRGFHYNSSDVIFVRFGCTSPATRDEALMCSAVIIHEMTHWISEQNDDFTSGTCDSEAESWRVSNQWLTDNGGAHLVTENWRQYYPQCQGVPAP